MEGGCLHVIERLSASARAAGGGAGSWRGGGSSPGGSLAIPAAWRLQRAAARVVLAACLRTAAGVARDGDAHRGRVPVVARPVGVLPRATQAAKGVALTWSTRLRRSRGRRRSRCGWRRRRRIGARSGASWSCRCMPPRRRRSPPRARRRAAASPRPRRNARRLQALQAAGLTPRRHQRVPTGSASRSGSGWVRWRRGALSWRPREAASAELL